MATVRVKCSGPDGQECGAEFDVAVKLSKGQIVGVAASSYTCPNCSAKAGFSVIARDFDLVAGELVDVPSDPLGKSAIGRKTYVPEPVDG